jgi:hypothetical protein
VTSAKGGGVGLFGNNIQAGNRNGVSFFVKNFIPVFTWVYISCKEIVLKAAMKLTNSLPVFPTTYQHLKQRNTEHSYVYNILFEKFICCKLMNNF